MAAFAMDFIPEFTTNNQVKVGDDAPNFKVVNSLVKPVELLSFGNNIKVIVCIPSIDTDVCDLQTKRFNQELGETKGVDVLIISNDLPFAQSRWCGMKGIDGVTTLSDYLYNDFGNKYGATIKQVKLIRRAVIVIDQNNKVNYVEYCADMGEHPDYEAALIAIRKLL